MKRLWLLFAQTVTVLLAACFVVATLKPDWLGGRLSRGGAIALIEAPASPATAPPAGSFRLAAQKASAAVVSINTSKAAKHSPRSSDPWFKFFFGEQGDAPQVGLGSGVIVSASGYVLTNNHVVEGADEIEVVLNDSRRAQAKIIGTDPDSDLAVLKIDVERLPVIVLGNADSLQVGDPVLAIGNPFGVGQTVTGGIVSALGRNQLGINTFENFIQTDAAINPGNSGGALVDINGNLLGINSAIYSRSGGSMGIGFAIPVSTAKLVLEAIVKDGRVLRGWIGVEPNELSAELAENLCRQGHARRDHHRRVAKRAGRASRHPPRRCDHPGGEHARCQCVRVAGQRCRPETRHRVDLQRAAARPANRTERDPRGAPQTTPTAAIALKSFPVARHRRALAYA